MRYFVLSFILIYIQTFAQIKGKHISVNKDYAISQPFEDKSIISFFVKPGEIASNGSRAELMAPNSKFEEVYSFAFRVVEFEYEKDKHFIIADWHHSSELHHIAKEKGETLFSPIVIHLVNDKIVLACRSLVFTGEIGALKKNNSKRNILKTPILFGEWNNVFIKIKWADDNKGSIEAFINDEYVLEKNIRTTYDMKFPGFFKLGIYRNLTYQSIAKLDFKNILIGGEKLIPDYTRKSTGEKNNNDSIINAIKKKYKQ